MFHLSVIGTDIEVRIGTAFRPLIQAFLCRPEMLFGAGATFESLKKTGTRLAFMDIGANDGLDTEKWVKLFAECDPTLFDKPTVKVEYPKPTLVLVEPDPDWHKTLDGMVDKAVQGGADMLLLKTALGPKEMDGTYIQVTDKGHNMRTDTSKVSTTNVNGTGIPVGFLPRILGEISKKKAGDAVESPLIPLWGFGMIKIDTEGADPSIILSLEDYFLAQKVGLLIFELNTGLTGFKVTLNQLFTKLESWKYRNFLLGRSKSNQAIIMMEVDAATISGFSARTENVVSLPAALVEAALLPAAVDQSVLTLPQRIARKLLKPLNLLQRRAVIISTFKTKSPRDKARVQRQIGKFAANETVVDPSTGKVRRDIDCFGAVFELKCSSCAAFIGKYPGASYPP